MHELLSNRARGATASQIRELLKLTDQPDVLSLAGGLPAAEALPVERIRAALASVVDERSLQYSTTEGVTPLRELIADANGVTVDHVLVTTGSQQALDLLARALIDPGDRVVVATPAYLGALQVFANAGADTVSIPSDHHGIDVDALDRLLQRGRVPMLVYVVANFHNPTGATLAAGRRAHLDALALRYGFVVVDDDPYGALRFRGAAPAPLARAVRLGSASKVLAPGLRVGWMIAPPWLVDACARLKQATDLHTSTLCQYAALALLRDTQWFDDHVRRLRALYRGRADALTDALTQTLGQRIDMAPIDGGLFAWIRFRDGTDTTALLAPALERRVAFVPGAAFTVDGSQRDAARLCFASLPPDGLREAVSRLAGASSERAIQVHDPDGKAEHDHDLAQRARR